MEKTLSYPPTEDELLALDLLTLREHTERAGDVLEPSRHVEMLRASLQSSTLCTVRRNGALVAYAMLAPTSPNSWFVLGFGIHPDHRTAPVFRELIREFSSVIEREGIADLKSNVYKTNRLSMAFHRKLGFTVSKENAKAVEFSATIAELVTHETIDRMSSR